MPLHLAHPRSCRACGADLRAGVYLLLVTDKRHGHFVNAMLEPRRQAERASGKFSECTDVRRRTILWEESTVGEGFQGIAAYVPDLSVVPCARCGYLDLPVLDWSRVLSVLRDMPESIRIEGISVDVLREWRSD